MLVSYFISYFRFNCNLPLHASLYSLVSQMFNYMVAMMAIFYLLEELMDLLLAGDLSAGIVDSSGVFPQFMDCGWFGVNLGWVGEGFTPLVMEEFNMGEFNWLDLGSLREVEVFMGQVVEGFSGGVNFTSVWGGVASLAIDMTVFMLIIGLSPCSGGFSRE